MTPSDEFDWSISISSEQALPGPREELEAALDDLLEDQGEVSGGRGGEGEWVIEIELFAEAPIRELVDELRRLLQEAGVARDTQIEIVRRQQVAVY